jgi:molybdenum cofactor cytidylyltransferase
MPKVYPPAAIVLSAGASRRMGTHKALLEFRGRTLLEWHTQALARVCESVVVVLGPDPERFRAVLGPDVRVVVNEFWRDCAMADSLRYGLLAAGVRGPCWVTPVDVPPIAAGTLDALLDAGAPAIPVAPDGTPGHPVLLDAATVASIREAAPQGGLRTLLAAARRVPVAAPDAAIDLDDPAAWAAWLGTR